MTPTFKKRLFNWKTNILKPGLAKLYRKYQKNLQKTQFHEYNFQKRKELIQHAVKNVPYYREKYKDLVARCNFVESEEEFNRLPILSREEVHNHFALLISKDIKKSSHSKVSTSGTTGPSVTVLHDKRAPHTPLQWRVLNWWDIAPYENKAFLYRYPRSLFKRIWNTLLWWPTRRIFLAGTVMDDRHVHRFLSHFNQIKPSLIQGYVDVIYHLALYLKDHALKIYPPKAVWVTAGPLSTQQREIMEEVFKAPVYDQYGSMEIMYVSAECREQNGLHIFQDVVHVECVDEENQPLPKGAWGKLLVTDLTNYAFPLIRYEIGDYGRLLDRTCPCGLPFELMDHVKGRHTDVIHTPSGSRLQSEFLGAVFDDYPNTVRTFQFCQAKDLSVELHYVRMNGKVDEQVIQKVVQNIASEAKGEIEIRPREVATIMDINGKVPLIIKEGN